MSGINFFELTLEERYNALEKIINDIERGKRVHNQDYFHHVVVKDSTHCKTGHCIAGWVEYEQLKSMDIKTLNKLYDDYNVVRDDLLDDYNYDLKEFNDLDEEEYHECLFITDFNRNLLQSEIGKHFTSFEKDLYENMRYATTFTWKWVAALLHLDRSTSDLLFEVELDIEAIKENFLKIKEEKLRCNASIEA